MESNAFLSKQEEAPLKTCTTCQDRPCIKTGKVCKDVEKLLAKIKAKEGYSERHHRRKLRFFEPEVVERIAVERAFALKYGKRKRPLHSED